VLDQEGQFARLGRSRGKSSQAGRQSCPALRTLVRQCLYLALDVSVIKGTPFVLIRVSLIYRGRAIPLAWRVLCHASASVSFSDYEPVTRPSLCVFARWPEVVLLADPGFVHAELLRWLHRHGWHYRIRLTSDTLIHFPDHRVVPVGWLVPSKGEALYFHLSREAPVCRKLKRA
jgi:hypothetical protein